MQVVEVVMDTIDVVEGWRIREDPGAELDELQQSIDEYQLIEPIVVRPHPEQDSRFQLIAGERRLEAMKRLGHSTIPANVRTDLTTLASVLAVQFSENHKRRPFTSLEIANAANKIKPALVEEAVSRRKSGKVSDARARVDQQIANLFGWGKDRLRMALEIVDDGDMGLLEQLHNNVPVARVYGQMQSRKAVEQPTPLPEYQPDADVSPEPSQRPTGASTEDIRHLWDVLGTLEHNITLAESKDTPSRRGVLLAVAKMIGTAHQLFSTIVMDAGHIDAAVTQMLEVGE